MSAVLESTPDLRLAELAHGRAAGADPAGAVGVAVRRHGADRMSWSRQHRARLVVGDRARDGAAGRRVRAAHVRGVPAASAGRARRVRDRGAGGVRGRDGRRRSSSGTTRRALAFGDTLRIDAFGNGARLLIFAAGLLAVLVAWGTAADRRACDRVPRAAAGGGRRHVAAGGGEQPA